MTKLNRIKYFRKKKGLLLKNIAEETSLAIGYISDLERDVRDNPSKEVMTKIAEALGETVQAVFFSDQNEANE